MCAVAGEYEDRSDKSQDSKRASERESVSVRRRRAIVFVLFVHCACLVHVGPGGDRRRHATVDATRTPSRLARGRLPCDPPRPGGALLSFACKKLYL